MVSLAVHAYAVGGAAARRARRARADGARRPRRAADRPRGRSPPAPRRAARRHPRPGRCSTAAALAVAATRRSRCCSCSPRCSRSRSAAHKPPRPRCCRSWRPTGPVRPPPTPSGWTAIDNGAFVVGAIAPAARGHARRRSRARLRRSRRRRSRGRGHARRGRGGARGAGVAAGAAYARRTRRAATRWPARSSRAIGGCGCSSACSRRPPSIEGMVDVLVVVTALELVGLGDAGSGGSTPRGGSGASRAACRR